MYVYSDYTSDEDIIVGNGKGIPITHTGSSTLPSPTNTFSLNNILCAPKIKNNLISVSQFCRQNNTSIEFFPYRFLVKDLKTQASLVRGRSKNNLYEWPVSTVPPSTNLTISSQLWHQHLGHPSPVVQQKIPSS